MREVKESNAIYQALAILENRVRQPEAYITQPSDIIDLLRLRMANKDREVFTVVFLDTRHGVISVDDMFFGNLSGCAVYMNPIARRAVTLNAAAIIVAHNHPSGIAEPSYADRELTERLHDAMKLLEIRLLDHVVTAGVHYVSFSERGWL